MTKTLLSTIWEQTKISQPQLKNIKKTSLEPREMLQMGFKIAICRQGDEQIQLIKKGTFSVHSLNDDYLSIVLYLSAQVAKSTFFMKSPVDKGSKGGCISFAFISSFKKILFYLGLRACRILRLRILLKT